MPPKHTLEGVRSIFAESGYVLLSKVYEGQYSKLKCICVCGNKIEKSLKQMRQNNTCYKCGSSHRRHTLEYAQKIFTDAGCTLLETEYKSVMEIMKYRCICGDISWITFNHFLRGVRCRKCGISKNSGVNHANYNPSITDEERDRFRLDWEVKVWSKKVKERDMYICQICRSKASGSLVSHHIYSYADNKDKRYDIENGVTLCSTCHTDFHQQYGYGKNTRRQFNEYREKVIV